MSKRLKCILAVLFLFTTVPTMVFAAGYALSGIGTKAYSMGGAFRAIADDYSAAYWNPAGLSQMNNHSVSLAMYAVTPTLSYTPNVPELGFENGLEIYSDPQLHLIPTGGAFFKFGSEKQFTAGLAILIPYGLTTSWNEYKPPAGFGGQTADFPEFNAESGIKIIDIHPTMAIDFNKYISLGFGLSLQRGAITIRKTYVKPSGFPYAPYDYLPLDLYLEEGTGWGVGFNIGTLLTPTEKLRIGIALRTGAKIRLEGDADFELYFPTTEDPVYQAAAPTLFTGAKLTSTVKAKGDLHTPTDLGIGFAYNVTDQLLLSLDMNQTYWRTAMDNVPMSFDGNGPTGEPLEDSELTTNWDDTFRISGGAEYTLNEMLALRAGYWFEEAAPPAETYRPTWADLGDKNAVSVGVGIDFKGFVFDAGYEYVIFDDRTIVTPTYGKDGYTEINRPGDYTGNVQFITTAITYNF